MPKRKINIILMSSSDKFISKHRLTDNYVDKESNFDIVQPMEKGERK